MNSHLSDFKAHILISLSGRKEVKKAQQQILSERTRLSGASEQEAHDGRGHCVLWEGATRMGDDLKGPKETQRKHLFAQAQTWLWKLELSH